MGNDPYTHDTELGLKLLRSLATTVYPATVNRLWSIAVVASVTKEKTYKQYGDVGRLDFAYTQLAHIYATMRRNSTASDVRGLVRGFEATIDLRDKAWKGIEGSSLAHAILAGAYTYIIEGDTAKKHAAKVDPDKAPRNARELKSYLTRKLKSVPMLLI